MTSISPLPPINSAAPISIEAVIQPSYPVIIHGSENSLDIDAYVVVPEPLAFKAAKSLCDSYKDINANLIAIKNGVVVWTYKGTKDECNNSILATYDLHEQTTDMLLTGRLDREYNLKMVRCIRGILSYQSRTELREVVKAALVSDDMDYKVSIMKKIDLPSVVDFGKSSIIETYKFLAFQMGQTRALLEDNVELFTKNSVAAYYPSLRPYLERTPANPADLQTFLTQFIDLVQASYTKGQKHNFCITNFHGVKEIVDVKKETTLPPVVIFDIDGTLMDEQHRAHLRDAKKWEEYFLASGKDTPIQHIVDLTHDYRARGYEIWLVSGRGVVAHDVTVQSLLSHNVAYDYMKLRGEGNFKPDYLVKPGWFSNLIGLERIEVAYDDTNRVIEALRAKGVNMIDVKTLGPDAITTSSKGKYTKV